MSTKKIRIDFYQVNLGDTATETFEGVLARIGSLPDNNSRTAKLSEHYFRLQELDRDTHKITGELIRIRMDQMPLRAKLDGKTKPIVFDVDEGLGEETAFLYYPQTGVLVIQRNRFGVTTGAFASYIEQKAALDYLVEFDPILEEDVMKRMAKMRLIRQFEVKVASAKNAQFLKSEGFALGTVADQMKDLEAPRVSVLFSMGRKRGGLRLERVLASAKRLIKLAHEHDEAVEKVLLSGRNEDNEEEVLDLLQNRMAEFAILKLDDLRRIPYEVRRDALEKAWTKRRDELNRMFRE